MRDIVAKASGLPALYMPKTTYDTDRRTEEKSKSLYLQFNTDWDTRFPIHTSLGVRYEKTDVSLDRAGADRRSRSAGSRRTSCRSVFGAVRLHHAERQLQPRAAKL